MSLIDTLVSRIRRLTHSQSFSDSATSSAQRGVQTQTIVDLLNEAHEVCHGMLFDNGAQAYIKESLLDVTTNPEGVTISTDSYLGVNVLNVEYKYGSESGQYRKLKKGSEFERNTRNTGRPTHYIQRNNQILLYPIPSESVTEGLRVTYEEQLATVDVRRGKVSAVDDVNDPTSITITGADLADVSLGGSELLGTYITVVDKDGAQQMVNIPVTAYNTTTGVITLGSFTSASSEVVAVGDFVVMGADATSHSPFPRAVEPFLVEFAKRDIYELIGDPMLNSSERKLRQLQVRVESMFSEWSSDIKHIPETDPERFI